MIFKTNVKPSNFLITFIFSFMTTFSFFDYIDTGIYSISLIIFILLFFYYKSELKFDFRDISFSIISIAALFATFLVIGDYFSYSIPSTGVLGKVIFISLIRWIGFLIFIYLSIRKWFLFIGGYKYNKNIILNVNHSFLYIILCWLPIIIAFYPGSVTYDGFYMLGQYYDIFPKSNTHPYLATLIMGIFMKVGIALQSHNLGIFSYIIFQTVALAGSFQLSLVYLKKWGVSTFILKLLMIFYMFCPVFPTFAQLYVKDTLFGVFCLIYSLLLTDSILDEKSFKNTRYLPIFLFLSAIMVSLLRHNGIFIILISLISRMVFSKTKECPLILSCVVISYLLVNQIIYPICGIESIKNAAPVMSAPMLQQTARYVNKYRDEIASEDKAVIDSVLAYDLLENYDPYLADPVLSIYRCETPEDWKRYISIWKKHFMEHPKTYIGALMHYSYLYYYPQDKEHFSFEGKYSISTDYVNSGAFDIHYIDATERLRSLTMKMHNYLLTIPGINMLYGTGIYGWGLLLSIGYLCFIKQKRYISMLVLPTANFLICCFFMMPVNGSLRYSLPVIFTVPYILGLVFGRNRISYNTLS